MRICTLNRQNINNQKAEIEFRKKIYLQQVEGKMIFDDEFNANGIANILNERMKKTFNQMTLLQEKGITLSPYIEIGAERCQRSLVMENDLMVNGASVDISYDMLKSCDYYKDVFNKSKTPIRICCDANLLPFMTNSVPFVFCYETLHHFREPAPITKEIYRVLSPGGCFFFDEEPFKKVLHINLYKGGKIYSKKSLTKSKIEKIFDYFFCAKSCNEIEHGIIENHDIPIRTWIQAVNVFDEKDVNLKIPSFSHVNLFNPNSYIKYFAAYLLGGGISGICKKTGNNVNKNAPIYYTLFCPSCREIACEVLLKRNNLSFYCPKCSKRYPVIDGVIFLFSYSKFEELYPEIFSTFQKNTSHETE